MFLRNFCIVILMSIAYLKSIRDKLYLDAYSITLNEASEKYIPLIELSNNISQCEKDTY